MSYRAFPEIDIEFKLRTAHQPGFLATVFGAVGKTGAIVGDIRTESIGKTHSIRWVIFSVYDLDHAKQVAEVIDAIADASVLEIKDVVFDKHVGGKIRVNRSREIVNHADMRYYYTPGVARVCQAIVDDPAIAFRYTARANTVAVVSNGTRVLGLGDIGALASLPVMEGKAMIYDQFVGISAVPILVDSKDEDEFVETVVRIALSFGGIHLEDIRVPDCFNIEKKLQQRLKIPVMHDDQHGTATVALAAVLSAISSTGRDKNQQNLTVAQIGLGAAGFGIASLLHDYGFRVVGCDPDKQARARLTKIGASTDVLADAIGKADIVIATTGVVGLIKPDMIKKDQIILALSNPVAEIDPDLALASGASFAADGKSVNNALAYPGLFRAALNQGVGAISVAMKVAAAETIASLTPDDELFHNIFMPELHECVVAAVEGAAR